MLKMTSRNKRKKATSGFDRPPAEDFSLSQTFTEDDDDEEEEREEPYCPKRLRSTDPDCKVIVGGKEFLHYSQILCSASEFFDTALSSQMKEGQTKVIEFPNKDPEEWKIVYAFIDSDGTPKVEQDQVDMLIPWFSGLQMRGWMKSCDDGVRDYIHHQTNEFIELVRHASSPEAQNEPMLSSDHGTEIVEQVIEKLEVALRFDLFKAKCACLTFINVALKDYFFFWYEDSIARLLGMLKDDKGALDALWPNIKAKLGNNSSMDPESTMQNPLLSRLLALEARRAFSKQTIFAPSLRDDSVDRL